MSENVRKLVGVAAMAVLVVAGVAVSSGDDTDFTRNTAFAKGGDETLDLLKSIHGQLVDNSSKLEGIVDTLRAPEASTSGASPDVEEIVDLMSETCPHDDPASWSSFDEARSGQECVRDYLVGFPLELAREVVLAHGKFGVFHKWNFDLGERASYHPTNIGEVATEEACEPIFYGYNPPPRMAIALDTSDGVVLPAVNEFTPGDTNTGYMQLIEHWYLFSEVPHVHIIEALHWPRRIEFLGICE